MRLFRDASVLGGSPERPLDWREEQGVGGPSRTKPPLYVCGQKVWLSKDINFRLPAHKLGPTFVGPFNIAKLLSPVTCSSNEPNSLRRPNWFSMFPRSSPSFALLVLACVLCENHYFI